jgi:hypothetical protein
MIKFLVNHPSKLLTLILLAAGLVIFVPVYYFMLQIFSVLKIDSKTFVGLMTSFDAGRFGEFFKTLSGQGGLALFSSVYLLNMVSTAGYFLALCSVTLIIARAFRPESRLYRLSFIFPFPVLIIAILDLISSVLFLSVTSGTPVIYGWVAVVICASYVIRCILLYCVILWIVFASIYIFASGIRRQK